MRDWDWFVEQVPWLDDGDEAEVGDEVTWSRGPLPGLPALSALLARARVTDVTVAGRRYELLAWDGRGWLCEPPPGPVAVEVAAAHREFWSVCGGIVERYGEPAGWWLNQDAVLTAEAAGGDVAGLFADYDWLFAEAGLEVPVDPADVYPVAVEANGNHTLAHRRTGRLLLFAPDHDFAGVTPLPGCPPNSLLTIDGVPDLRSWIETCAATWSGDAGRPVPRPVR